MKVLLTCLLVVVFLLQAISVQSSTPSGFPCSGPISIHGDACKCFEIRPNFQQLECKYLQCTKGFTLFLEPKPGFSLQRLIMEGSKVKYIPRQLFEGDFIWIEVKHSVLKERLFEFVPENNKIYHLLLNEVKIADEKWSWEYISPLKKLTTLRMGKMPLGGLQNFTHFAKSLKHIILYGCDVRKLRDDQFQEYKELEMIDIRYDRLKELKRSMFPSISKVRVIIFRNNHLTTIPEDLFEGMKDLTVIDFQQNRLTVLSETTFKPILSPVIFLQGNPLTCDCKMKWILEIKMVKGNCETPESLKGKELKDVEENLRSC